MSNAREERQEPLLDEITIPSAEGESEHGAEETPPEDSPRRLLLVALPEEVVALPAEPVVEVLPERVYAHLPGAPRSIAGIANRRGRMLTVVDLGIALGGAAAAEDGHRVVIVSFQGREVGLAVRDVLQFATDWWSHGHEGSQEGGSESESLQEEGGADAGSAAGSGGDEQLRVIEVESVLAPLFGGEDHGVGEPTEGRP